MHDRRRRAARHRAERSAGRAAAASARRAGRLESAHEPHRDPRARRSRSPSTCSTACPCSRTCAARASSISAPARAFPALPLAIVNPERSSRCSTRPRRSSSSSITSAQLLGLAQRARPCIRAPKTIGRTSVSTSSCRARSGRSRRFVKWSGHLCVGGGRLLAMKGRYPHEELEKLPSGWKLAAVHRLNVPGLDEERHLVEICRSHDRV